jgi:SAM-dependent methyltransferase
MPVVKDTTLYREPGRHTYMDARNVDFHHAAILDKILEVVGLKPGDHVVEIGAGSGRYSELLLAKGFRVTAVEPDPVLYEKSLSRLGQRPALRTICAGVGELPSDLGEIHGLCGFHVLHHLDIDALQKLKDDINQLSASNANFRGWFFLEPNPFNVLYPLQISVQPGMNWREERGIWNLERYRRLPWTFRYACGFLPPQICRILPTKILQAVSTSIWRRRLPWMLYEILGGRSENGVTGNDPNDRVAYSKHTGS